MIGFDILILAAILGVGGSLLLAKSNLQPSFTKELAQSFYGSNPYQVRSLVTQRIEAIAGAIWLCGSLPLMALGTIITSGTNQPVQTSSYVIHAIILIVLGVIGGWLTLRITDRVSRTRYLPQMVELQREIFSTSTQYLKNGGVSEQELPNQTNISDSTRKERLATVTRWLNQIGALIDVPRKASEADDDYLARLRPFFDK
jgi:hypothetical protein